MKSAIKYLVILLLISLWQHNIFGQKFTIPVFPDTQIEIQSNPEMFYSQVNWIVQKKDSLNIPIVLHVGDVVNFDSFNQWEIASKGYDSFDKAQIPYAITLGNHDGEALGPHKRAPGDLNQNLRKTFKFNSYFPSSRFCAQRGRFEADKSDNAYYTFKVGNTNWLVVTLEFNPRLGAINWARDVTRDHSDYNVIILTHFYLMGNDGISNLVYHGDSSPQDIFDRLVNLYPNIRYVLCGHTGSSTLKVGVGKEGNKIYSILQDYQGEDFGGGYLRLLTFDIDKATISAQMYSPYYNMTKKDYSQFTIEDVDFLKAH